MVVGADFWGEAVPAWVGAIGSIAASAVATIAFLRDIRTRKGLNVVATAANERDTPSRNAAVIASARDVELLNLARSSMFRNRSDEDVTVVGISTSTEGTEFRAEQPLPHRLGPGEVLSIRVHRSIDAPSIAELHVRWYGPDEEVHTTNFFA